MGVDGTDWESSSERINVRANWWQPSGSCTQRHLETSTLEAVVSLGTGLPKPDLSIIIDITVEESYRRKSRPEEREALDHDPVFLNRVRQNFLDLAKRFGWTVVDGMSDPDEVAQRVTRLIDSKRSARPET